MACAAGPDVSESGLVLALDGGNNKSHSSNRFISYGSGLITQDISFQVNGNGTFQRVAAGTVIGGYVVKTTDVVYSYALGSNGCHYHGNSAPIPAGSYATFSFDYLVTGATTYPITDFLANFENYGGGALSGSVATANILQNVWQRRTFTSGPTFSAGTQAMFLYPGSCGGRLADSGTIYFRNPKVEWTNVDTGDGNFSSMPNVTTWYDMSGNGNNGTLTNTPYFFIGNASTGSNGYISFDGTNDYIDCGNASSLSITVGTVCAWFKKPLGSGYKGLVDKGRDGYGAWSLNVDEISNRAKFKAYISGSNREILASSDYGNNVWTYVCGVYDGTTLSIYQNGIISNSASYSGTIGTNSVSVKIGAANDGLYFDGNVSNAKIYNRALTAQEVQQNYNATRGRYGI